MLFRHYLTLIESKDLEGKHLWIACTKDCATRLMTRGPENEDYFADTPEGAENVFQSDDDSDEPVILEFKIKNDLPPMAVRHQEAGITVHDPNAVKFVRVWSGVIDDRFKDEVEAKQAHGEIDEVAIGGLKRCTAVTCNAILKRFVKQQITLGDVPETDVGVLEILTAHGLAYKPVPNAVGRTLRQFVNLNQRNVFYLVTPGHAIALVDGEIFDAENRGADGRVIEAAYLITPR